MAGEIADFQVGNNIFKSDLAFQFHTVFVGLIAYLSIHQWYSILNTQWPLETHEIGDFQNDNSILKNGPTFSLLRKDAVENQKNS